MNGIREDVRYAARAALRRPGLTASAVLTLALAIAANSAVFSVVRATLLKPLPFPEPDRLVRITGDYRKAGARDVGASQPEMQDYREKAGVFEELAGVFPISANLTGGERPARVETLLVSPSYFSVLGARPLLGRLFVPEDEIPGIAEVAVISHGLWQRSFGSDPRVLGRRVEIDRDLYTIVAVMPPDFRHPGQSVDSEVELWAPAGFRARPFPNPPTRRGYFLAGIFGRLKAGVTVDHAQERLTALGAEIRAAYPNDYRESEGWAPRVTELRDDLFGRTRPALLMLLGAVGLVLLIAGVNIAGLLLARAAERGRELALRTALGASRARLIRQMLIESLLLAFAGGGLGLLATVWSVDALVALAPDALPRFSTVRVDGAVVAFTFLAASLSGVLAGIVPALQGSHGDVAKGLKESSRGAAGGRGHARARAALVASELALAMVLLVGASLLVRSFWRVLEVDPGFRTEGTLVARVWLPQPNVPETGPYFEHPKRVAIIRDVLRRVSALPGVLAAGSSNRTPLDGNRATSSFSVEGKDEAAGDTLLARVTLAGPGYLEAIGIPLLRGRALLPEDDERAAPVVLVNQAFAKRAWPGQDALGKHVKSGAGGSRAPWLSVVGVVGDTRADGLDADARPEIYRSQPQVSSLALAFVLRAEHPEALVEPLRREVQAVDPDLPVYAARTLDGVLAVSLAQRRFAMTLVALFGAAALALSAIGVYGVMAESVQQRRREIGIRMALGAEPQAVARLVVSQGLRLAVIGACCGLAGAAALAPLLSSLLYGVTPGDPWTFLGVPLVLLAVAGGACWLPARRAASLDPTVALRCD